MKKLIWQLILPLTIISFAIFTKWWYALVVDGPDEILLGFPLPYVCSGWHTSLSLQIFILEFLVDFLTYFLFWFAMVLAFHRFIKKIYVHKWVTIIWLTVSGCILAIYVLLASNPDNIYTLKRDFEMEVMETGYKFLWQKEVRPDFYKYHPERKEQR